WTHPTPTPTLLLSHGDILITEDPRFSVQHTNTTNVYVVKIREVSAGDAGSYQCQVPVSEEEEEELRVEAAPPVEVTLLSDNTHSLASPSPTTTTTTTTTITLITLTYTALIGLVAR
ncbi:hypothetical protein Pcinc_038839, partial [Petrolisthes cinctipes]